jgi:hypothetical protein
MILKELFKYEIKIKNLASNFIPTEAEFLIKDYIAYPDHFGVNV